MCANLYDFINLRALEICGAASATESKTLPCPGPFVHSRVMYLSKSLQIAELYNGF
jgi:hypothetical protein